MSNFSCQHMGFKAQNAPKPVFGRGSAPDSAEGSLWRSPRRPGRLGRRTPPPHSSSVDTFSVSTPSRRLRRLTSSLRLIPTVVACVVSEKAWLKEMATKGSVLRERKPPSRRLTSTKAIKDSNPDFRINPASDLDVCHIAAKYVVDSLCRRQSFCRVS